jgi:hypothetical protein
MMRLRNAFVLLAVASCLSLMACSGKSKPGSTSTTGSGSDSPAVLTKKFHLSWGIQQGASSADVFLQTTDETGHQVSHALGTFKGTCAAITPAPEMKAIIGVLCKEGATGTELHAVEQGAQVIVLKMPWAEGATPDPMDRTEVTRIGIPSGASVDAG